MMKLEISCLLFLPKCQNSSGGKSNGKSHSGKITAEATRTLVIPRLYKISTNAALFSLAWMNGDSLSCQMMLFLSRYIVVIVAQKWTE